MTATILRFPHQSWASTPAERLADDIRQCRRKFNTAYARLAVPSGFEGDINDYIVMQYDSHSGALKSLKIKAPTFRSWIANEADAWRALFGDLPRGRK